LILVIGDLEGEELFEEIGYGYSEINIVLSYIVSVKIIPSGIISPKSEANVDDRVEKTRE